MAWAAPVLKAIRQVLEGDLGTVRTVATTVWQSGYYGGAADALLAERALIKPRYDVVVDGIERHDAPMSEKGNLAIMRVDITIPVVYYVEWLNALSQTDKEALRTTVLDNAETARQALMYPGNLATTTAATATNLISGLLLSAGPFSITREDFDNHVLEGEHKFYGLVKLTPAIS